MDINDLIARIERWKKLHADKPAETRKEPEDAGNSREDPAPVQPKDSAQRGQVPQHDAAPQKEVPQPDATPQREDNPIAKDGEIVSPSRPKRQTHENRTSRGRKRRTR